MALALVFRQAVPLDRSVIFCGKVRRGGYV
jgi:hypothetical protein